VNSWTAITLRFTNLSSTKEVMQPRRARCVGFRSKLRECIEATCRSQGLPGETVQALLSMVSMPKNKMRGEITPPSKRRVLGLNSEPPTGQLCFQRLTNGSSLRKKARYIPN
jgi:hypothetical protein